MSVGELAAIPMSLTMTLSLLFGIASVVAGIRAPRWWVGLMVGACVLGGGAAARVLGGRGAWELSFGGVAFLRLDPLAAVFLLLICVLGVAGTLYAGQYWDERWHPRSARWGRVWWGGLFGGMALVVLSAHGMLFLLAWEAFALSGYFLITLDRSSAEVRRAGWLYLAASHAGTLMLFAFFTFLAERSGGWALGPELGEVAGVAPLFWLALLAFGIKAGMFPLHIWLPSAHANAPSHVSAIFSGVAIKMGIYGIVRFSGWLPAPPGAGWVIVAAGVASAVLGVAFALGQHDFKRLLAYHSVENIGIILMGVGFGMVAAEGGRPGWGALALVAGLWHVWNHGLFKGLLFLGAGAVIHATGTREMSRLGGLWRRMPWTAGLFALGAVAISGLPPLNGFISEWLLFSGLFEGAVLEVRWAWVMAGGAIALAATGALALACFAKVCGIVFLGAPRGESARRAHECGGAMRGAMGLLAAGCVALGLAPVVFWPAMARAASCWGYAWPGGGVPDGLSALGACNVMLVIAGAGAAWALWAIARWRGMAVGPTWDCGYAAPSARMQYTAGSFASLLVAAFAWILRPIRHEEKAGAVLPAGASREDHVPETVLDYVLAPMARAVLRVARVVRQTQRGRVQDYLLYLLFGVVIVAAVLWGGGAP